MVTLGSMAVKRFMYNMGFQKAESGAGPRAMVMVLSALVSLACSQQTTAAEAVTVFLLDKKYEPVVRLEKIAPPGDALRAILAMYALQNGGGCESNNDPTEDGLHCILTTKLGVGPQCSEAHLRLVRAWFKSSLPPMSVSTPDQYLNIQRPGSLEEICYSSPNIASFQRIWERIRVKQDGAEVFVDAVGSWMSRDQSGHFHFRTTYKIEDHSITAISHEEVPWKGESKEE
jgi:hypothetical protein